MKKKVKFELPVNSDDLFEIEIIHTVQEWEKIEAEIEALRAKLVTADQLAEQAAKTISYSNYMEPALYVGLERALNEYREKR